MPKHASSNLRHVARRLLVYEASSSRRGDDKNSAAFHVCEKLRRSLSKFMGSGGFRSLLSRALAIARLEVNWLNELEVKGDGSLEGVDEVESKLGARAVAEGEIILVAELLGLLITFIGPVLTKRLLNDSWPQITDLEF